MKLNRENFMPYAGIGYMLSNTGMAFGKPIVEALLNDMPLASVEPEFSATGGVMLASSMFMALSSVWGSNAKLASYTLGSIGWAMLTADAQNAGQLVGDILGLGGALWGTASAAQEVNKKRRALEFQENAVDTSVKYPYAIPGLLSGLSSSLVMLGSLFAENYLMTGVSAVWTGCAALVGLSKPKAKPVKQAAVSMPKAH